MRRIIQAATLLALLTACGSLALAQDDQQGEFKMGCPKVVRLGLNKFANAYGEATQDYSTAGQKAAFAYYTKCKREANDDLASKLLPRGRSLGTYEAVRSQLEDVRDKLNKFGEGLWTLKYYEAGGGTMWGVAGAGAYATREDYMSTLIRVLTGSERKMPRSRRAANAQLATVDRWLASSKRKPFNEYSEAEQVKENEAQYKTAMAETKEALAGLRALLLELPDAAANSIATRMAVETRDALSDSN